MTILVAGHTGLAGSSIFKELSSVYPEVVGINSQVVDLRDRKATFEILNDLSPEVVIDAAALSGGINFNNTRPVDFISQNLQIQTNLMDACHAANVNRFVFLGSSCIYPKNCNQPILEDYLMTGKLESTNSSYAIAKIAGIELVRAYRKQFGRKWISIMPTNLYGPSDNFNIEKGHVLPALINKFVTAANNCEEEVIVWGSGSPKREFLHSEDLAKAVELLLRKYDSPEHLNVGTGEEISIFDLAKMISSVTNFKGRICWDRSMPDGTPRKVLDITKIKSLGWRPSISLREGIERTVEWYRANVMGVKNNGF